MGTGCYNTNNRAMKGCHTFVSFYSWCAELKEKSSDQSITTRLGNKGKEDEEDIQSLLDEEFAMFSQSQAGSVVILCDDFCSS